MKTALLTGLAAFALGATCATALTGTGSAAPVATRVPADDTCSGPAASDPTCVVERLLTLETPSPVATAPTSSPAGVELRGDGTVDDTQPGSTPGVKLRGDGTVDDTQPGTAASSGDGGDRSGRRGGEDRSGSSSDDGEDRSGRRGGEDRSGGSHDDDHNDDDDRDDRSDDDHDRDDDDGTADQGSGDR